MRPRRRLVFILVLLAAFVAVIATPKVAHASIPNIVDGKGTRHTSFGSALANVPEGGSVTLTVANDGTPVDLTVNRNINVTLVPERSSGVFPALGSINISAGSLTLKRASTLFVVMGLTKVSGGSLTTDGTGFYNNIQATGNAKISLTDSSIQDASYYNKRSGMLATLDLSGKVTCDLYRCSIHGNVYVGSGCTIGHLNGGGITMDHVFTTRGKYGLLVDSGGKVGEISNCTIYGADGSIRFKSRNTTPIEGCTLISGTGKQIVPGTAEESDWNGARVEKSLEKTQIGVGPGNYYGYDREFDATWFKTLMPEDYRLSRWTRSKKPLFVDTTYASRYLVREDCRLIYDANGGSGSMARYNKRNQMGDLKLTVASCIFTMEGATFKEWNTKPDGTGTSYKPQSKISFEKQHDVTLYAQWAVDKCTVTFDSRGGSKVNGVQVEGGKTVPRPADPTRPHYKFQGWYEDEKYTKEYNFSAKVQRKTLTLYAKWGGYAECHVWERGTVQKQPTCTQKGTAVYTCKADPSRPHSRTLTNIEPLGHDTSGEFELDPTAEHRDATCTAPGLATYNKKCKRCGEVIETSQRQTKPLGHDWGEWKLNEEGTKETRTCKHDASHTETRVVKQTPCSHTGLEHVDREESTCTYQGHVEYWVCPTCQEWFLDEQCAHPVVSTAQILLPLKEHEATKWEPVREPPTCSTRGIQGGHVRCAVCNTIVSSHIITLQPTGKHTPVESGQHYNIVAPTCESPGSYDVKEVCKDCGTLVGWTTKEDGEPLGHVPGDPVRENVEEPSCEEDGSHEDVVHCTRCGEALEYTWVHDEPLGHNWSNWETMEKATEFDEGLARRVCMRNIKHQEWRTIPTLAHEHSMMHIEAEASTCSLEGHKEYWYCERCGDWFLDEAGTQPITSTGDILLPRLAHTPGEVRRENEVAATCTEKGHYDECTYCTVCNELLSRKTVILQELQHDWDEWKTVTPAIGTDSGLERRTCKRDASHTEDRVIHAPHTHTLEHVDEVKATCWTEGKKEHWRCADLGCGAVFSDKGVTSVADSDLVTPMLEHVESDPVHEVVREATCTEEGLSCDIVSCTLCGMELEYDWHYAEPLGHDWGPWTTTKEATEFEEGEEERVCRHDAEHKERRAIPVLAHTHRMLHVAAVDATCTKEGNNEYWYCEKCREWFLDEAGTQPITDVSQVVRPRVAHTPGETKRERVVAATCIEDGHHDTVVYCSVCNAELSRTTATDTKLGHDWGDWQTVTPAQGTDAGLERRVCSHDESHVEERVIPAWHTHTIEHVAAVPATCTKEGKAEHWHCTDENCGAVFSDNGQTSVADSDLVIPRLGHTPGTAQRENEIAATCTEDGHYDECVYCTVCGEQISRKTVTLHAHGHDWGKWQTVTPAQGTDAGLERRVCSHNENHVEERVIPAWHTHTIEHVDAVPATCTKEGKAEHWHCTDANCGAVFSDNGQTSVADSDLVIPRLGHTSGEVKIENVVAATCTADGHHDEAVYCTVCGTELSRKTIVDKATGHSWDAWRTVTEPTDNFQGYAERSCSKDPTHKEGKVLPALHTHAIAPVAAVPATCTKEGMQAHYECTDPNCGAQFSDAEGKNSVAMSDLEIPRLGHVRGSIVQENVVAATCTEDGRYDEVVYCTRAGCGAELSRTTVVDRAKGHDWGPWETKDATEDEEGEVKRVCQREGCSHEEKRTIPKKPHVHAPYLKRVSAQAATCTKPGNKEYWHCWKCGKKFEDEACTKPVADESSLIIGRLEHMPGEARRENVFAPTCTRAGSHDENVYCTACGKRLSHKTVIDKASEHDWDEWQTVKEATPEEPGLKRRTCKREGCSDVDEHVIPATGYPHYTHDVEYVEQVDPTCWEEGMRAHWRCIDEGCGALFSDLDFTPDSAVSEEELVLPCTDHQPGEEEEEDFQLASCTEGGHMENAIYCQTCGEELERDSVSIPPIGHNPGEAEREYEQKATCYETGWHDEAVYCTACEEELSRRTVSDPCKEHTPSETVILNVVEPTTTTGGSHDELIYCTVCYKELSLKHVEDPAVPDLYYVAEGDSSSWAMGSTDPLRVVFKRNENDEETFSRFTGIRVDDKVVDVHLYEANPGSVIIDVAPDYLKTLSAGEHTLTGVFTDGLATAKFTIVAATKPESETDLEAEPTTTQTQTSDQTPTPGTTSGETSASAAAPASTSVSPTVLTRQQTSLASTGDPNAGIGATVAALAFLGIGCLATAFIFRKKM